MVIRCSHVSLYMCATSFCICMVCVSTLISFSGLHSFIEICASGMIDGGGIYLVSLFCSCVKLAFIMFCKMFVVFWCNSLLGERYYVQQHLGGLMKITLFEASIYCILCC